MSEVNLPHKHGREGCESASPHPFLGNIVDSDIEVDAVIEDREDSLEFKVRRGFERCFSISFAQRIF